MSRDERLPSPMSLQVVPPNSRISPRASQRPEFGIAIHQRTYDDGNPKAWLKASVYPSISRNIYHKNRSSNGGFRHVLRGYTRSEAACTQVINRGDDDKGLEAFPVTVTVGSNQQQASCMDLVSKYRHTVDDRHPA